MTGHAALLTALLSQCAPTPTLPTEPPSLLKHLDAPACEYGEAISCIHGDTIVVDLPNTHPLFGKSISIRIRGIDAPELHGKHPCERAKAMDAAAFVVAMLEHAKVIRLTHLARDKYFRVLADVEADGKSVGAAMLGAGLAVDYQGQTKIPHNWCR
jgi:micrococcal nuclease